METNQMMEISLINKNYEKILDTLNKDFKSSVDVIKTRHKILKLLDLDDNTKIENCFSLIVNELPDEAKIYNEYSEINQMLNKFGKYLLGLDLKDHGYTLLLLYFFWLTRDEERREQ